MSDAKQLSNLTEREKYGGKWRVTYSDGSEQVLDMKRDNNIRCYAKWAHPQWQEGVRPVCVEFLGRFRA